MNFGLLRHLKNRLETDAFFADEAAFLIFRFCALPHAAQRPDILLRETKLIVKKTSWPFVNPISIVGTTSDG